MKHLRLFVHLQVIVLASVLTAGENQQLKLKLSWGHRSTKAGPFHVGFLAEGMEIADISARSMEPEDKFEEGICLTQAGSGDVDAVELTLRYPNTPVREIDNLHSIWAYLIEHSDEDTAHRLRQDPAYRRDSRKLIVRMNREGTKGFAVTIDQLLQNRIFWVPSLDIFLTAGDSPANSPPQSVAGRRCPQPRKRVAVPGPIRACARRVRRRRAPPSGAPRRAPARTARSPR